MDKEELIEFNQFPVIGPETKRLAGKYIGKVDRLTMAAGAVIFAHNKILLNRSDNSDLWSIPGATLRPSESPIETVKNSLKAELNLKIEILDQQPFIFTFSMEDEEFADHIYLLHFLAKVKTADKIIMGPGVADYKWASIASHFRDCYPNVKAVVDHYLNL
jgi:ADP-ribose pyrophosphatase YjhB (NUDIX family)